MKPICNVVLGAMLLLATATTVSAQEYPSPTGYVNDFANMLTREQVASLNTELVTFDKKTTIEIAVVTVPKLGDQSIEDYTRGLAKAWGVGKRSQNNGVVFLIAPTERKMRIQTASGAREILTDDRADEIRDTHVLPAFKSRNMAKGIIDGTHAIMQTFTSTNEGASRSREWTSKEFKTFGYVLVTLIGGLLLVQTIRRSKVRKYVVETKEMVSSQLDQAQGLANHPDVGEKNRQKLMKLKEKFLPINRLTATSTAINWIDIRDDLDSITVDLRYLKSNMDREIAFADKARREGPELMKRIPGMIEEAEKKLAEGNPSREAMKQLKDARRAYTQVQTQQSGMGMTDWVTLYLILMAIESNTANATNPNTDQSSSFRSSDSSDSGGFGGFGGGGGFDSGGGSSGSW